MTLVDFKTKQNKTSSLVFSSLTLMCLSAFHEFHEGENFIHYLSYISSTPFSFYYPLKQKLHIYYIFDILLSLLFSLIFFFCCCCCSFSLWFSHCGSVCIISTDLSSSLLPLLWCLQFAENSTKRILHFWYHVFKF